MRPYPIILAAGAMLDLPVEGNRFFLRSTTGAVDVKDSSGRINLVGLLTGEGSFGIKFTLLFITNNTASAITLELMVSDDGAEFTSSRVQITGSIGVSNAITASSDTDVAGTTSKVPIASQVRATFRCDQAMVGTVTIGGLPYTAGESDFINTSAAISVVRTGSQTIHWRQEAAS